MSSIIYEKFYNLKKKSNPTLIDTQFIESIQLCIHSCCNILDPGPRLVVP